MNFEGIPWDLDQRAWRYYVTETGAGCWNTKADEGGWYWSWFCKRAGRGARTGGGTRFQYVPRTLGKRRRRSAAEQRSWALAGGEKREKDTSPAVEHPPGTGYCMSEKKHVIIADPVAEKAKNGRNVIRGKCPDCGTSIQKFGKVAECPECGKVQETAANDYICKECRQGSVHEI